MIHTVFIELNKTTKASKFVPQFIYSLKPKLTIPIKSVFGNNEGDHFRFLKRKEKEGWFIDFYKEAFELEIENRKIAVYHGSNPIITDALIKSGKFDAVFTGHNHQALIEKVNDVLHVNPGTTAGYCQGKITNNCTVAIYQSVDNSAIIYL